jgi:hypothetical protein
MQLELAGSMLLLLTASPPCSSDQPAAPLQQCSVPVAALITQGGRCSLNKQARKAVLSHSIGLLSSFSRCALRAALSFACRVTHIAGRSPCGSFSGRGTQHEKQKSLAGRKTSPGSSAVTAGFEHH